MINKRIISLIMCIVLALGASVCPVMADAGETSLTAYLSVSRWGSFVAASDGSSMAMKEICLTGKASYTLDDLLSYAHDCYYVGGAAEGYASSQSQYGLSLDMLWGDSSGMFGYQINGGTESVGSLAHPLENGDCVDVHINKSYYPDNEAYAVFDSYEIFTVPQKETTLSLRSASGYNPDYTFAFSPCEGAMITVDGQPTEKITASDGSVKLSFGECGVYTVSASKEKTVNSDAVPAITAPVCKVTVEQPFENTLHSVANALSQTGISDDVNMPWFAADMAVYETLATSRSSLTAQEKALCVQKLISLGADASKPSDIAKYIIALRALGYDASKVCTKDGVTHDLPLRLANMADSGAASVTNVYTLPYVIIALQQSSDYANGELLNSLITHALENKASWQNTAYGADAAVFMLLALAPCYNSSADVKSAFDETVEILRAMQLSDGTICGYTGQSDAAVTGLAIAALSAIGVDSAEVKSDGSSLVDGLLSMVTSDGAGFEPAENSFATEQGMRGLLAYCRYKNGNGGPVYDFLANPLEEARADGAPRYCPVSFSVTPAAATVTVQGAAADKDGIYDLDAGEYSYTVSASGYSSSSGTFTVSEQEASAHSPKTVTVALNKNSGSGSSVSANISISVKVMTHSADKCNNSYSYKNNSSAYSALVNETVKLSKGQTVYDALKAALDKNNVKFVEKDGYVSSIGGLAEFDHGGNSGWQFTVDGKHSTAGCRNTRLASSSEVVWYYTDDYTKEQGTAPKPSPSAPSSSTTAPSAGSAQDAPEQSTKQWSNPYGDVAEEEWYFDAVKYVSEKGIMNGSDIGFEPQSFMTRAQFAAVIVRALDITAEGTMPFDDVSPNDWYYEYVNAAYGCKIINGVSDRLFNPHGYITRQEIAVMTARAAELCGNGHSLSAESARNILAGFEDYITIASWASQDFAFCVSRGVFNGEQLTVRPLDYATRAEIAQIFCNLDGKAVLK